ncbi:MAG: corrinoid protein-associated methyltransferase CpaM [Candidatus Thorarchaeota archaeon]
MKVLEETPDAYESGIAKLTASKISEVYERILENVKEGSKVLDLGCGPGTLAILCAKKGAQVVAMDFSDKMITFAQEKSQNEDVADKITFIRGDITQLDISLPEKKFDLIISTLALSELRFLEQQLVFDQCWELLTDEGRIAFADEAKPHGWGFNRLVYSAKRLFYGIRTYWKTKKTTRALEHFPQRLSASGFEIFQVERFVGDTFMLIIAQKSANKPVPTILSDQKMRGIRGWIRGVLCVLRAGSALIPIQPGLYTYGNPTSQSPVLVTANYQLTVRRVGSVLQKQDIYLLVADTMGENVWCAARGDKFSTKEVDEVIKATRISELVDHRRIILPQLAAGGIDHREVKKVTGWRARFGPIYAKDIPAYLRTGKKTEKQRTVSFGVRERLEMALQESFFLSKFLFFWLFLAGFIGITIFPTLYFFEINILLLPILWFSYLLFAIVFPLFPTRSFLKRSIMYGLLLGILLAPLGLIGPNGTLIETGQWLVIGFSIGHFQGMDYSGATPMSKPTEIDEEYPTMIIILGISLIILLVLTGFQLIISW